jgi:hypothetical protein
MGVGVIVGLVVKFAVLPPLHFWDAEHRIRSVTALFAEHLGALADVLDIDPDQRTQDDHAACSADPGSVSSLTVHGSSRWNVRSGTPRTSPS